MTNKKYFVTVFPRLHRIPREFPEFSMFREIPKYSRFSRFVATLLQALVDASELAAPQVNVPMCSTAADVADANVYIGPSLVFT